MNKVPSAMVFAAYDWGEPGEEVLPFIRVLKEREHYTEELSSIDEIRYGYVCVARHGDVEFAFLPSDFIDFVRWAVHNYKLLCESGNIFLSVKEENIIFKCSRTQLVMRGMNFAGTGEEWRPLFGRPLPYASSYELRDPRCNSDGQQQWPGIMSRSITINTRDWLEGVIAIGEHLRQLLLESRPLIEANPSNFENEDDISDVREAYKFCEEYPMLRVEMEQEMLTL